MKLAFLELPVEERRLYIEQAVGRNILPVVLGSGSGMSFGFTCDRGSSLRALER